MESVKALLTNDDGIAATGLQTLRKELLKVPGLELIVIAPDGNRSASARSITTRRPLKVTKVEFGDGTHGFACDGTPVDCVRLATHGLVEGFDADIVVSGINHGANLGDDITYSGTVAAALEGILLGRNGVAVSQRSSGGLYDHMAGEGWEAFQEVAEFTAKLVRDWGQIPLQDATIINVNAPPGKSKGVKVTKLGRRKYMEDLIDEGPADDDGGRTIRIYAQEPVHERVEGTDLTAVDDGYIAVTPIHLDLTDHGGLDALAAARLGESIAPLEAE